MTPGGSATRWRKRGTLFAKPGLGVLPVRGLVEQSGGQVMVASVLGEALALTIQHPLVGSPGSRRETLAAVAGDEERGHDTDVPGDQGEPAHAARAAPREHDRGERGRPTERADLDRPEGQREAAR